MSLPVRSSVAIVTVVSTTVDEIAPVDEHPVQDSFDGRTQRLGVDQTLQILSTGPAGIPGTSAAMTLINRVVARTADERVITRAAGDAQRRAGRRPVDDIIPGASVDLDEAETRVREVANADRVGAGSGINREPLDAVDVEPRTGGSHADMRAI